MISLRNAPIILLLLLSLTPFAKAEDGPKAVIADTSFKFGKVTRGTVVEHEFSIRNDGRRALAIKNVVMSTPLKVLRMPASVAPGGEGTLKFALDTAQVGNFYEGVIVVTTDDPVLPEIQLGFDGNIISTVEVSPMPAFYVSSQRGEAKEASLEIINHEEGPLRIESVESQSERFTLRVQSVEDGKRYELILRMNPKAPLGKNDDVIRIHTSSTRNPLIRVGAHTFVRERVYTFPLAVEFGQVRLSELRAETQLPDWATQRLVVYDTGGEDFQVDPSSDLPFVKIATERAATGDRYQLFVTLDPMKLTSGNFKGTLQIKTNDPAISKLSVPITISVME